MKSKIVTIAFSFILLSCFDDGGVSSTAQLEKDIKAIDEYLAANGITNVIKDASGIRLVVDEIGTDGLPPNIGNDLKVNYTGRLLSNGALFDAGTVYGKLTNYILGWQIGLSMLPEGSFATLYIPSGLAYGPTGSGAIPGNANLIFEVELESVTPTTQQLEKLDEDIAEIDAYLDAQSITAIQHESGMRYVITETGTGDIPALYDQVKISYKGNLLSNGNEFYNQIVEPSALFSSRPINYPHGVMLGLQLLSEGGKATFYVPSVLAYGNQASPNVPANSNIIFEIELLDVIE